MEQVKVAEATEAQLDWMLGVVEGYELSLYGVDPSIKAQVPGLGVKAPWKPTRLPNQMVPIMEREKMDYESMWTTRGCGVRTDFLGYRATHPKNHGGLIRYVGIGPNLSIAAARCYIASKRGEVVEVPEALRAAGRLLEAAGVSDHDQPTALSEGGVIADLPAGDIQHLVQAFRKGGMVIEQDIPEITKTPFRAQVRGEFVPFSKRDALAVEQVTGEPLCVIPHVVPFAMPLSVAITKIADLHWKSAVQGGHTTLGLEDWKRQYLLEHTVIRIIEHIEQRQG